MRPGGVLSEGMLDSVIEQLRSPLFQIQLMAEAGRTEDIAELTRSSLRLIEDLQYVRELKQSPPLDAAPVNVAVMSDEIAHSLYGLAASRNVELIPAARMQRPVLAHGETLRRAYENMVRASIALSEASEKTNLRLSSLNGSGAARIGVHGDKLGVSAGEFKVLKSLFGVSRRPLAAHSTTPCVELFLADRLFAAIGGRLKTSIDARQRGFAARLATSNQLALIA